MRTRGSKSAEPAVIHETYTSNGISEPTILSYKSMEVWQLPEVLLYHVACFAAPPTCRAAFICQSIAPLCKSSFQSIMKEEEKSAGLWQLILKGDYGTDSYNGEQHYQLQQQQQRKKKQPSATIERRCCKRLRRCPIQLVRDAHLRIKENTELAYFYLWELCYSVQKNSLTRVKLLGILQDYGPNLMINRRMSSGGTFLVEVCRSKTSPQHTILLCVQELVRRGALVDVTSHESENSHLTALCVAAVRGMPKVVEFLLSQGASADICCSGRFRLFVKKTKYLRCTNATPLEFAQQMMDAEKAEGATDAEVRDLGRCIQLLSQK